jgi:hypothetical protein
VYDSGSHCGETITITRTDGSGGSVDVLVHVFFSLLSSRY